MPAKSKPKLDIRFKSINSNNNNHLLRTGSSKKYNYMRSAVFGGNFSLSRRINEKNSVYSREQWNKDFQRSRIYKKISCEYPSINFVAKRKRKLNSNHIFGSKKELNYLGEISFKPYSSVDGDDDASIGSSSNRKNSSLTKKKSKKNKKRNFGSLSKELGSESSKKSDIFSDQTSSAKK